jgi:hypothetical protein
VIRFAWIQARTAITVGAGALVVTAVVLGLTGPHLAHLYDTIVRGCSAHGDCSTAASDFLANDRGLQIGLDVLIVVVPGLLGIFWGAPLLAREFEAGTYRLAWTQSVTRTRWLAAKLGVLGLASMVVAGLLSLMVTWWSSPVDLANMNRYVSFDQRDLVPVGYAAFAFALGATAGVVIRRTIPAMAATLVAFVAARLAFAHWVRPHLIAPVLRDFALSMATVGGYGSSNGGPGNLIANPPDIANAWVYQSQIVDTAGRPLSAAFVTRTCPQLGVPPTGAVSHHLGVHGASVGVAPPGEGRALQDCVSKIGATFHELVSYQPASRYWTLQWYELAAFLAAALVLGGFCLWWIRPTTRRR